MSAFRFLALLILLTASLWGTPAAPVVEEPALGQYFEARGVEGCFAVFDPSSGKMRVYHPARAQRRFAPASTFKIANALIGLEAGAVAGVDEVIPYGGTDEIFDAWERDMTLREAMKASNVAVFHQLAKRIGIERMSEKVRSFGYGNGEIGSDVEHRFWLSDPLAISALEQVDFLARVASNEVGVNPFNLDSLKSIIEYEAASGSRIFAKSGWAGPALQIGWWVGWVEKDGLVYPFAMNADIPNMRAAKHRIPIALDCLEALGVIE